MFRTLNILLAILVFSTTAFGGVDFDGADDYISVTDPASEATSFMTISAWVYYDTATDDDYVAAQPASTGNTGFLFLRDETDSVTGRTDCFTVLIDTTTDYRISSASNSAPSGQWIHVAFTFSGSAAGADEIRLYINGVEDANSPTTAGAGSFGNSTANFFVGANSATASNIMADGKISELAIWFGTDSDSVLTANQISQLALSRVKRMPLQINPHRLLLYLPMDDQPDGTSGDGDTYKDISRNTNNGTGNDGANNTGLTNKAEEVLTYP